VTPAAFLDTARAAGVSIWDEAGVLRWRGPRAAVERLVPVLKAHKPAILAALARESCEVDELREMFDATARILDGLGCMPTDEARLEGARVAGALARNQRYLWSSLRAVLKDYPALLAMVPDRDGVVDALPLGVARHVVLKDGRVVKQGEFTGPHEAVRCCDCQSFIPDTIGDGLGAGRCSTDGESSRPEGRWQVRPVLWARAERRCGGWAAIETA
jgi:hypothetical protein